jgi:selenoprotein W-related protein
MKPTITITYCTGCRWLLRASWNAQELLTTFEDDIAAVTLTPSGAGGIYTVSIDGIVIWDRKQQGRFPEMKELKQLIRDNIAPDKNLGHSDTKP